MLRKKMSSFSACESNNWYLKKNKYKIKMGETGNFCIRPGLRQGSVLSSNSLSLVMIEILKDIYGEVYNVYKRCTIG